MLSILIESVVVQPEKKLSKKLFLNRPCRLSPGDVVVIQMQSDQLVKGSERPGGNGVDFVSCHGECL